MVLFILQNIYIQNTKEINMEKYLNVTSIALGSVGGLLAYTLGGWDQLLWVLLYFMVADCYYNVLKYIASLG